MGAAPTPRTRARDIPRFHPHSSRSGRGVSDPATSRDPRNPQFALMIRAKRIAQAIRPVTDRALPGTAGRVQRIRRRGPDRVPECAHVGVSSLP